MKCDTIRKLSSCLRHHARTLSCVAGRIRWRSQATKPIHDGICTDNTSLIVTRISRQHAIDEMIVVCLLNAERAGDVCVAITCKFNCSGCHERDAW